MDPTELLRKAASDPKVAEMLKAARQQSAVNPQAIFKELVGLSGIAMQNMFVETEACLCGRCLGPRVAVNGVMHMLPNGTIEIFHRNAPKDEAGTRQPTEAQEKAH